MTEKLNEWQKAFKLKGDLKQSDLVAFETALIEIPRGLFLQIHYGGRLRAAIEAGWIDAPKCEVGDFEGKKRFYYDGKDVEEMNGGAVRWLGQKIDEAYQKATEIPKNL